MRLKNESAIMQIVMLLKDTLPTEDQFFSNLMKTNVHFDKILLINNITYFIVLCIFIEIYIHRKLITT